jgi:tetratricopeptide (TPR) repeat protein
VVVGDAVFGRVRITGFEGGRLFFEVGDGTEQSAWIDEARRIIVDTASGFEDFNDAETALADGDHDRAIGRYERALRRSRNYWEDVISCRLAAAYLADGRLDRAAGYFIAIARSTRAGPGAAARLLPGDVSSPDRPAAVRAVEQLDSAVCDRPVRRSRRRGAGGPRGASGGARRGLADRRRLPDSDARCGGVAHRGRV